MTEKSGPATFSFQAEINQLLHLMVHSLYSNREIFLRELISNASDANDKLRFESLASPELLAEQAELEICVRLDPEGNRLIVSDTGIGMTAEEIAAHLGTIAHSGTAQFLGKLSGEARQDAQLIGQFGVGFYSAFIVADEVEVLSRRAGLPAEQAVRWVSDGKGEYTVEPAEKPERGTQVALRLKEDARKFLDPTVIESLIHRYSDHIAFPVRLARPGADGEAVVTVNEAKALWTRPRAEIEDEEYLEFYKHIAHDFSEPLAWSHNRVEGKREYTSLLYVPSVAPLDLWNRESPRGIKLYVQRVFISDEATQFLPLYLRFVRGVVDSSDLPLNISRELLQQDPNVAAIKSALTKRVLDVLEKLAREEPDKFATFWKEFGTAFKEGLAEDPASFDKIAALLRFNSTHSEDFAQDRSLEAYVEAAPDDQKQIYYLIAESPAAARSSPHLEALREQGTEVLLLSDRIDEWVMQFLREFGGKTFKDVSRGMLEASESATVTVDTTVSKSQKQLLKRVKRALRDKVDEVRISGRLTESASCLVFGDDEIGFQMRELLKASGHEAPTSVPSLELNDAHPLVRRLETEKGQTQFDALAQLLLDQALLLEGQPLDDPAAFVKRMNALLVEPERQGGTQDTA
jgi:molecular chaperone HtpG